MKVAAYCRVSTDKQDQANSFESQKRYFREYIERKPDWDLYEIYADEGFSGTSTKKRVAFNRMISDATLGRFDMIITKEVSRFSRNILDTISFTRDLRRLSVGVMFMNDGINTLEPDSELRLSIMGSIAQEESRKTSSRVKWGQTRQMERGVVFGRSMLGYDVKSGKMTVNPDGAEIVKLIFQKYVEERKGTSVIARELREAGYKTVTGNANWTNTVILKTIRNEKYCGDLCQKKTYTPDYLTHDKKYNHGVEEKVFILDHHVPIVDRELWYKAQKELERRDVDSKVKEGHGNRYPLSGKIKCGECGATFVSRYKKRNNGTKYKCWCCGTATAYGKKKIDKAGNEVGCDVGKQLREEIAMNIVKQSIDSLLIDKTKVIDNITSIVTEVIHDSENGEHLNLEKLEKQMKSITEKKKIVLDAFFSQNITKEEMRMMNEKYDIEIAELTDKINAARKKQNLVYSCDDIKKDVEKKVSSIVNSKTVTENLYGNLLRQITVFGDEKIEVELHLLPAKWQFIVESLKEIEKRTKTTEKPVSTGFSEDMVHCEHDVSLENANSETRIDKGLEGCGCHCEHDVPISVKIALTSA
jgi:DNA invertase Pin-like site-specific DNA recombinase